MDDELKDEQQTEIKNGKAQKKKRKRSKGEITVPEVQNAFYYFFKFYAWVRKSAVEVDEKELKTFATHYVVLAGRFPVMKVIVSAFAPLATVGEFLRHTAKVEKDAKKPFPNPFRRKKKVTPVEVVQHVESDTTGIL